MNLSPFEHSTSRTTAFSPLFHVQWPCTKLGLRDIDYSVLHCLERLPVLPGTKRTGFTKARLEQFTVEQVEIDFLALPRIIVFVGHLNYTSPLRSGHIAQGLQMVPKDR